MQKILIDICQICSPKVVTDFWCSTNCCVCVEDILADSCWYGATQLIGMFCFMEKIWSPNIAVTILKSPGRLRKLSVVWRRFCLMGMLVLGVVSQTKQVPSLKLTYPLKIGLPNRKFHLLTIHFQGRTVSFREGIKAKYSHFYHFTFRFRIDIVQRQLPKVLKSTSPDSDLRGE